MGKEAYLYKESVNKSKVILPIIGKQDFKEGFIVIDEDIAKQIVDNTTGYSYKTKIDKVGDIKKDILDGSITFLKDTAKSYQDQLKIDDVKYKRMSKDELKDYCIDLLNKMKTV